MIFHYILLYVKTVSIGSDILHDFYAEIRKNDFCISVPADVAISTLELVAQWNDISFMYIRGKAL